MVLRNEIGKVERMLGAVGTAVKGSIDMSSALTANQSRLISGKLS